MTLPWLFSPKLAYRVWQREVTLYRRIWPSTLASNLLDPFIYLVAMGFGLGAYVADVGGRPYIEFIAPGLIGSAIMMAATYEVAWNSYVRMFIERSYEAMMSTPATVEDVVAGELFWAATRSVLYASVMLVVLAALGLLTSWWALAIPLVALPGGLLFASIGLTYTTITRHMDQLTFYFTLFVTPLFLFSGIFFPLDRLPAWVKIAAWFTPLYHLVEVARGLAHGALGGLFLAHLAVILVATVALFGLPVAMVRRRLVR